MAYRYRRKGLPLHEIQVRLYRQLPRLRIQRQEVPQGAVWYFVELVLRDCGEVSELADILLLQAQEGVIRFYMPRQLLVLVTVKRRIFLERVDGVRKEYAERHIDVIDEPARHYRRVIRLARPHLIPYIHVLHVLRIVAGYSILVQYQAALFVIIYPCL